MRPLPDAADVERFRRVVGRRLGLHLDETRLGTLAELLRQRVQASHATRVGWYLDQLSSATDDAGELHALAEHLTVGETYFFRDPDQLRAFAEVALAEPGGRTRSLRILSAGCASGEEPYSLAALARDRAQATIIGFDVNPAVIAKAMRGRYSDWSLRQTPADARATYFRQAGREHAVVESVRQMVSFEVRNLLDADPEFWRPGSFDVVFLRNVIMYFSPPCAREVIARVAHSLRPGGYLFLGHAESLRGISDDFELQNTHGTFYHRRREAPAQVRAGTAPPSAVTAPFALELEPLVVDSVAVPAAPAQPIELLQRAVLLTNSGQYAEAESVCDHLLASDPANAGARYLLALIREQAGEIDAAIEQDRAASQLDDAFAMPHLHMGLLARRAGDQRLAQRSLARAMTLLAEQDEARTLLYGGGFSKEGLIELCRAELRSAGVEV
jgi:chemotaxis protein methyltransferase CheR